MAALHPGSVEQLIISGSVDEGVALKVTDLQEANGKFKCNFSDGKENVAGLITSQVRGSKSIDLRAYVCDDCAAPGRPQAAGAPGVLSSCLLLKSPLVLPPKHALRRWPASSAPC